MKQNFCPSVIDFEASGFGSESYPIEVGVVTSTGERYCSLIRPHDDWQYWDESAQSLHGLSRDLLLRKGRSIRDVCCEINAFANNAILYSDAWVHDKPWLTKLFFYGGLEAEFTLSPIESIVSEEQLEMWDEVKEQVFQASSFVRHRASNDAFVIQQTFLETRRLYRKRSA